MFLHTLKKTLFFVGILLFIGCQSTPTQFSEEALKDVVFSIDDKPTTVSEILSIYKGKKIVIDVWASWCSDCIKGLPKVKKLQEEFPEVVFLFFSVDKKPNAWKKGIERFAINGVHYNFPKGMKEGSFVEFINLNWIPHYMVVNEQGEIAVFKAINANDKEIINQLKK